MSISSLQAELRSYRDASSRASGDIAAETLAISAIDAQLLGKNALLLQARGCLVSVKAFAKSARHSTRLRKTWGQWLLPLLLRKVRRLPQRL